MKSIQYLFVLLCCLLTTNAIAQESRSERATYTNAEQMPEFPGCELITDATARKSCAYKAMIKHVGDHLNYPADAKSKKLEGTVVVQFVVDKEGKVTKSLVTKGFDKACEAEALRVVNEMPVWKPGVENGERVAVQMTLPIRFSL
ncbi:MAG: energy transducer TonB [Saprospiraceae bacterium]